MLASHRLQSARIAVCYLSNQQKGCPVVSYLKEDIIAQFVVNSCVGRMKVRTQIHEFRCSECGQRILIKNKDGFFLRIRGALFQKDQTKNGLVKCKVCKKWIPAPIYLNI